MKKQAILYGIINDGKLQMDNPNAAKLFCGSLEDGTPVKITIEKQYKEKTQNQLGYYYGVLVKKCTEVSGYSDEEVDGIFCKAALTQNKGLLTEYVKSKALCDTTELNHLIDIGRNLAAAHWGVVVDDPDKNWRDKND